MVEQPGMVLCFQHGVLQAASVGRIHVFLRRKRVAWQTVCHGMQKRYVFDGVALFLWRSSCNNTSFTIPSGFMQR
jgi:hypothetical protein